MPTVHSIRVRFEAQTRLANDLGDSATAMYRAWCDGDSCTSFGDVCYAEDEAYEAHRRAQVLRDQLLHAEALERVYWAAQLPFTHQIAEIARISYW